MKVENVEIISLSACTKKKENFIYTMYKTCRFLSDACFFSIVCFMHFINHGSSHDVT